MQTTGQRAKRLSGDRYYRTISALFGYMTGRVGVEIEYYGSFSLTGNTLRDGMVPISRIGILDKNKMDKNNTSYPNLIGDKVLDQSHR